MALWHIFLNILLWGVFVATALPLFCVASVLWLVTAPFDPNRKVLHQFTNAWGFFYILANPFWSLKVKGRERIDKKKVYVIVANHLSMADIPIIHSSFLHFKWVSKKAMFYVPVIGWNLYLNGHIPIERGDEKSREKCLARCREWLAKGSSIFFFPEGTRSPNGELQPFKLGAFELAIETKTDILPMVIRGSHEAVPKHSVFINKKSKMSLEILPPISVEPFLSLDRETAIETLKQTVWNRIAEGAQSRKFTNCKGKG